MPLTKRAYVPRVELHFIEEDLDDHSWYVELVADFVDDVQRFVLALSEEETV